MPKFTARDLDAIVQTVITVEARIDALDRKLRATRDSLATLEAANTTRGMEAQLKTLRRKADEALDAAQEIWSNCEDAGSCAVVGPYGQKFADKADQFKAAAKAVKAAMKLNRDVKAAHIKKARTAIETLDLQRLELKRRSKALQARLAKVKKNLH